MVAISIPDASKKKKDNSAEEDASKVEGSAGEEMVAINIPDASTIKEDASKIKESAGEEGTVIVVLDGLHQENELLGFLKELPSTEVLHKVTVLKRVINVSVWCSLLGAFIAYSSSLGAYPIGPDGFEDSITDSDYLSEGVPLIVSSLVLMLLVHAMLSGVMTMCLWCQGSGAVQRDVFGRYLAMLFVSVFFGCTWSISLLWTSLSRSWSERFATTNFALVIMPVLGLLCLQINYAGSVYRSVRPHAPYALHTLSRMRKALTLVRAVVQLFAVGSGWCAVLRVLGSALTHGAVLEGCTEDTCPRVMVPAMAFYPLLAALCASVFTMVGATGVVVVNGLDVCAACLSCMLTAASVCLSRDLLVSQGLVVPEVLVQGHGLVLVLPGLVFLLLLMWEVLFGVTGGVSLKPVQEPTTLRIQTTKACAAVTNLFSRTKILNYVQISTFLACFWMWNCLDVSSRVQLVPVEMTVVFICGVVCAQELSDLMAESRSQSIRQLMVDFLSCVGCIMVLWSHSDLKFTVFGEAARFMLLLQVMRVGFSVATRRMAAGVWSYPTFSRVAHPVPLQG